MEKEKIKPHWLLSTNSRVELSLQIKTLGRKNEIPTPTPSGMLERKLSNAPAWTMLVKWSQQ